MNENAARLALKSLIVDNADMLVDGFSKQGASREIHQVTTSSLTPPTGYFFVSIIVTNSVAEVREGFGRTTAVPPSQATYSIAIDIADYALGDPSEDQLFEKLDSEFQIFTDRIVSLIRETRFLTHDDTGLKFRLTDSRSVTKNNVSANWEEAAQYAALLGCRITFTLLEECTDDSTLYL